MSVSFEYPCNDYIAWEGNAPLCGYCGWPKHDHGKSFVMKDNKFVRRAQVSLKPRFRRRKK